VNKTRRSKLITTALAAGLSLWTTIALAASITVTDGDTIRVDGEPVRLVGFNAPETYNAQCGLERELGEKATARLETLVSGGALTFEKVACACRPDTEGTNACNYGRACGRLRVDGRDVGDVLIAEGLAVPFVCGTTRCPPTPRPWCQ
jgi:endonuclease YncB( thermonuclease family)